MLTRRRRGWELPESRATDEALYWRRRELVKGIAAGSILLALPACNSESVAEEPGLAAELYPAKRDDRYGLDRQITAEELATSYNNFYEFGSHKQIASAAQDLRLRPWQVAIDGMVERELTFDAEELIRKLPLEERLYRHRCVEAWSMAVPWTGFPLAALVAMARPLGSARYLRMETFHRPDEAPGQRASWYPWPYVEGLTMAEATNELAFIATGLYGKPIPKQNGAPSRLVTPWKYGFKSVKSIVRFTFTDQRPVSFWETIQASEYGFWANVNPDVPHPRWSQAQEKPLGGDERVPTLLFNGYAEFVADLYRGLGNERLFA
jgi:methionine sulfoxide reductase catalytic subunit